MGLTTFTVQARAKMRVSKYGGDDKWKDGGYLGQCVSLINQYCWRVLSVPAGAWGHAISWGKLGNPYVAKYFDRLNVSATPKRGDILVYGAAFGGGLGHIEIYLGGGLSLYQNRNYTGTVGVGRRLSGYYAILRKKLSTNPSLPLARTTGVANVRKTPKISKGNIVKTLPRGYEFHFKRLVSGQNIDGNPYWYKTKHDQYIWSGNVRRKP